jgi:hypothetical protein
MRLLPNSKGFNYVCYEDLIKDTTPLHLVNCLFNPDLVQITESQKITSVFAKFLEASGNFKPQILSNVSWPTEWHSLKAGDGLADVPLVHNYNVRLEHLIVRPWFYQSNFTEQLVSFQVVLVSYEKIVVLVQASSQS